MTSLHRVDSRGRACADRAAMPLDAAKDPIIPGGLRNVVFCYILRDSADLSSALLCHATRVVLALSVVHCLAFPSFPSSVAWLTLVRP